MRPVRYSVAASLDGFIADRSGGYGWIPHDPTVDFGEIFAKVDTILVGRRTYEAARAGIGGAPWAPPMRVFVFSTTMRPDDCPEATLVAEDAAATVAALRAEPGDGEIWLFGGGDLFQALAEAGQVDRVEVAVAPVILGGGTPLIAAGGGSIGLELLGARTYPSGMVRLSYSVTGARCA